MATNSKALQDLNVVHRLCFATRSLPIGAPHYWETVRKFGIQGKESCILSAEECRVFVENLQEGMFDTDTKLIKELVRVPKNDPSKPDRIGFILLSPNQHCILCNLSFTSELIEVS